MIILRRNTVKIVTILSVILGVLWLSGFGWAIQDYYSGNSMGGIESKAAKPMQKKDKQELTIVALGDSLTRGTGDETGKGYVGLVTDDIKKRFKNRVTLHNLGINGQTSTELQKQVKQNEVQRQLASADTILITIGGNDLFQGGQTLMDFDPNSIGKIQAEFINNLTSILTDIRKANRNATIFYLGLYNPFIELENGSDTSKVVREWNDQSERVSAAFPKTVFVPTFDIFQLSVNDYLYTDNFHPNKQGYQLIAERVAPLIKWEEKQQ
ncbi:GDSL family lipase [Peribacillus cavernae]|uniref:GDSL family lipase n=1 Tax=Peribacillus cavernae TaxID=1674310 RepID=A0A433HIR3_9BACI|nr:SGNH/GDSL hydrolase family protein [Peribacillus cavernae]MDQ0217806.1 lysophospholipase L1-like esterase [Peribacillus cavernae]RUQ28258.1 GDSL family lipase [Peribacillus cavernae]